MTTNTFSEGIWLRMLGILEADKKLNVAETLFAALH